MKAKTMFRELTDIIQIDAINFSMNQYFLHILIFIVSLGICQTYAETGIIYDVSKGYQLNVDGQDFEVKGVAGEKNLEILKDFGGNTIRTWAIDKKTLDKAHELGLKVVAGIWVEHMRHDDKYDYTDPKFIRKQRKKQNRLSENTEIILLYWHGVLEMRLNCMFLRNY